MRVCLLVGVVLLAQTASAFTAWIDRASFDSGVHVREDVVVGQPQLWAWVQAGRSATVQVGETTFELDRQGGRDEGYTWQLCGKLPMVAGETLAPFLADPEVAALALSNEAGFDPARASRYTHVMNRPGGLGDRRHEYMRNTDTVYTMPVYETVEEWEAVKETLRRRTLLGCGLYPLPEKTPLNANISGRIERDGYSIEKVYFEAWPGFLVTGNLYRPFPLPEGKKIPAILCPHGHWEFGRLQNNEDCSVPGRSITLAKLGATVFTYDKVGYVDSMQFSTHRWLDKKAKLWGVSPFALQLWSSIRAVDFVESLPEVDADRIGCTGASGGGTQTFALYTVDDRIKVAAPVNMISCSMQGGCVCENGPLMRLEHSNMEIGATIAPRPLLMVSATGDWTRETPRIEHPSINSIYKLYNAEDKLEQVQVNAGHNYNQQSREAVYRFFAKHLLELEGYENFTEPPFTVEPDAALRVFPDGKLPEGFLKDEALTAHLVTYFASERAKRMASISEEERTALLTELTGSGDVGSLKPHFERLSVEDEGDRVVERWLVGSEARDERMPLIYIRAKSAEPQPVAMFVNTDTRSPWLTEQGELGAEVSQALQSGLSVALVHVYGAGPEAAPEAAAWLGAAGEGFSDTFLPTAAGERVRDLRLLHHWATTRRDIAGLDSAHAADAYGAALLRLSGVPNTLVRAPEETLGADALEGALYVPGYLALFEPSMIGLR
jgi:hypothetical protein